MITKYFSLFLLLCLLFLNRVDATIRVVQNLNDFGIGSLRDVINISSPQDTVRFSSSLLQNGSDTLFIDSTLIITVPITIEGLFTTTDTLYISGSNSSQIFRINTLAHLQKSVIFKNQYLIDGYTTLADITNGRGGAIYFLGDSLFIYSSVIKNCTSRHGAGVAVDSIVEYLHIENSKILNNAAEFYGGGIASFAENNNLFILNSEILFNTGRDGAGLCCFSSSSRTSFITIINSEVSYNTASNEGGGIRNFPYDSAVCNIINSKINYNKSNLGGGIVNRTENSSSTYGLCTIIAKGSEIIGDTCKYGGGGIQNYSWSGNNCETSVILDSCTINNNKGSQGGGIYNFLAIKSNTPASAKVEAIVSLNKTTMMNNYASSHGGGIFNQSGTNSGTAPNSNPLVVTNINNSTIANCRGYQGGGVFTSIRYVGNCVDSLIIRNSTITNCKAPNFGGAVYAGNSAGAFGTEYQVDISNSTIVNNEALEGGGIYHKSSDSMSTILCESSIIALNKNYDLVRFYKNADTYTSLGNNFFSDTSIQGYTGLDSLGIDSVKLNLSALQYNGGSTFTLLPNSGSVVINKGNPFDLSDAQNAPINGIRDAGSTESFITTYISKQKKSLDELYVYPNPSNNYIFIVNELHEIVPYTIFSVKGEKVIEGQTNFQVNLANIPTGTYFLNIKGFKPKKIIRN